MRAAISASQTCSNVAKLFEPSPGGTTMRVAAMPAARERGLGGREMMLRDVSRR